MKEVTKIWSRENTLIICIFTSTDGWICVTPNTQQISILSSTDEAWLKKLKHFFDEEKISTAVHKGRGTIVLNDSLCAPIFKLHLHKRYPKYSRKTNQYQIFRDSIDHWGLHDFIRTDKFEKLCKMTSPPRTRSGRDDQTGWGGE